jgi:glycopeptide antibiotics resistance protein
MLTIAMFAAYMLLLTAVIIFKLPFYSADLTEGGRAINLIPFGGSFNENGKFLTDVVAYNVLFFVPFGIYISMLKNEWSFVKKALSIFGLTLAYEITQFIFAIGRTDIICNSAGGLIGIAVYAMLFKVFKYKTNRIITILAVVATILIVWRFGDLLYRSWFSMRR